MAGELRHGLEVGSLRVGSQASQDHVLDHLFAELRHGGRTSSAAPDGHGRSRARDDARMEVMVGKSGEDGARSAANRQWGDDEALGVSVGTPAASAA